MDMISNALGDKMFWGMIFVSTLNYIVGYYIGYRRGKAHEYTR